MARLRKTDGLRGCGLHYGVIALAAVVALLLLASASPAGADELSFATSNVDPELLAQLDRRGELSLRDTELSDALMTISESWQVNIVVGNEVSGKVNGVFRDTTLREILAAILESNGYTYRPVGRSLVVQRKSDNGTINPFFQTATIPIGVATPEELVEGAQLLASAQGRVQAVASANSLLVFDTPERINVIRQFVTQMDRAARLAAAQSATGGVALDTADFAPQYVDVKAVREVVQSLVSKDGRVGMMESENRLVVLDYQANLDLIRRTIERIDVPRPQVRITAYIYDLSLDDIERLGINWSTAGKFNHDSNGDATSLLSVDSVMQLPAAATEPSSTVTLMNLSRHIDVTGVVNALKSLTNARLLADPTVTVIDREKATIQIVTEIPYQQLTQTGNGGNIGTTAFREAGVTLAVTPKIANDGTLHLEVNPSFSRLSGFTTGASPAPIIDKRETNTTVRVTDGQTLVIGGLRQRSDTRERRGVPYLKDRKHIGHLFRARNDSVSESELVVFITPEIIMPSGGPSTPRQYAAEERVRNELERVPIAPQMVWPNAFGFDHHHDFPVGEPCDDHLVHPPVEVQTVPTPEVEGVPTPTPAEPIEEIVIPDVGTSWESTDEQSEGSVARHGPRRLPVLPTSHHVPTRLPAVESPVRRENRGKTKPPILSAGETFPGLFR